MKIFCSVFALFIIFETVYGDCGVVSKAGWDGLTPIHVEYLARPVDLVIIQHTVTSTCTTNARCAEIVRAIQTNHMDNLGYWDIASSFIVGGNGKIYEGAGWLHVGAHTYGYNRRSIGITFIGNYNNDTPTKASLDAVKALLRCGVQNGHLSENYHIVGHRQLIATESPGRKLYNEIRRWPHFLDDVSSIKN
ncbi:hypothetical protein B5X24_HaOG205262 [Helicoverpa armigera]|uniref:Peptidoglycan-recognition protein n=1 Tax=Helicoverpa armigera TaxID=29058 RepID=A0A2W1BLP2_HELAM|nr:hypothetical protein B5X24_HaOG205262 [Helicoverpa armigera]